MAAAEKSVDCCEFMSRALNYTHDQSGKTRQRPLPGLVQGLFFDAANSRYIQDAVVYMIPGTGRGKGRTETWSILIKFCPFCGAEHQYKKAKKAKEKKG